MENRIKIHCYWQPTSRDKGEKMINRKNENVQENHNRQSTRRHGRASKLDGKGGWVWVGWDELEDERGFVVHVGGEDGIGRMGIQIKMQEKDEWKKVGSEVGRTRMVIMDI